MNTQLNTVAKTLELSFRRKKGDSTAVARPAVKLTYAGFAAPIDGDDSAQAIAAAANSVLELYAKALIDERKDDWDYLPTETELTLANWQKWDSAVTARTRSVTAATLLAFSEVYKSLLIDLGKPAGAAAAGAKLICDKLVPICGNRAAMQKMEENIAAVVEVMSDEDSSKHEAVVQYLLKVIDEAAAVVSGDDL